MEFGTTTDFLTHVVVVVTCPAADGGRAFYLLDPTFNMHFSDQDSGAPITVEALLNREKAGRLDSVRVHLGSLAERTVVKHSGRAELERFSCGSAEGALTGCGLDIYLTVWAPAFERNGFGTGLAGLLNLLAAGGIFRIAERSHDHERGREDRRAPAPGAEHGQHDHRHEADAREGDRVRQIERPHGCSQRLAARGGVAVAAAPPRPLDGDRASETG